jgi:[acyl-carrier-protein] S-malonyltransferase
VLLPISAPSHCTLMRPAAERLGERLALVTMRPPRVRVINNADVAAEEAPDRIRSALVRQLYSPVRWVESVTALARAGVQEVVECGPGAVLSTLCRRIAPDLRVTPFKDAATLEALAMGSKGQ